MADPRWHIYTTPEGVPVYAGGMDALGLEDLHRPVLNPVAITRAHAAGQAFGLGLKAMVQLSRDIDLWLRMGYTVVELKVSRDVGGGPVNVMPVSVLPEEMR